ncbi:hypothetical protein [Peribacillus kribbensis]|uniref:hypothetical protein n=1 Tax=Peribacillus kribbensis TaxID=356658 RepID=UPI00047E4FAB|nr:hypothetical protein [Peribacillus kribbensis]
MGLFRNRIKPLFFPALVLWILAGVIYLVSPWYYGPDNIYIGIANIYVLIGFSLTLFERYTLKKATKKQLIGFGIAFFLVILIELLSVIYFY